MKPSSGPRSRASLGLEGVLCAVLGWFIAHELGLLDLLPFLRGGAATVVFAAVLGGLVGLTRAAVLLRAGAATLFCLWMVVAFTPLASSVVAPLKMEQSPEKADAVVVLQAGMQRDNDFSASTLERTLHGLELVQQGFAPRLILTEVPSEGSHERAALSLMKNLGVGCELYSVSPVSNTHDEAVLASRLARKHGWKKVLLVTSPTHSRRASLCFRKTGLNVLSTPCRETAFDFENLNRSDAWGRTQAFAEALREIVGLRVYRARGWA